MRLLPLEIGRLEAQLSVITGATGYTRLPVPSWLIEHPEGLVLFDTGLHASLQRSSERIGATARMFRPDFEVGEELAARLRVAGVDPALVSRVIFSHLHFDHAGGTCEIPNARIVVQEAEWIAGKDPALIEQGAYNPADYALGHEVECVNGRHDVFGDGRIVCIPTPGHTAGHQALRVELESGPVVLTGDCIYFAQMLDKMRTPRFGLDLDQQRASMRVLKRLRDEEGCRLLFGHDAGQLAVLPREGLR